MIPAFSITADGADITAKIADRLISARVIDEEGFEADRFEIALDDRDGKIETPKTGAAIEIAMGWRGRQLTQLGRYVVDTVRGESPPQTLIIGGKAADMAGPIRSPKTRAWEGVTLQDIVGKIARGAGLTPAVPASLASTAWSYIAQTAESDLHFLTRLARDLDATVKPAGGKLMIVRRGAGTNADDAAIDAVAIPADRWSSYSWSIGERQAYKSVEAEWQEWDTGETHKVSAGSGDPRKVLRHPYATEAEAQRAVKSHLAMAERAAMEFEGSAAWFAAGLFAGGTMTLAGIRAPAAGDWLITRVVHELGKQGLVTRVTAQKAAPEANA